MDSMNDAGHLVDRALLSAANAATVTALLGLHLVAATVMIPALARSLRRRSAKPSPTKP